jgi:hypothetical protein
VFRAGCRLLRVFRESGIMMEKGGLYIRKGHLAPWRGDKVWSTEGFFCPVQPERGLCGCSTDDRE